MAAGLDFVSVSSDLGEVAEFPVFSEVFSRSKILSSLQETADLRCFGQGDELEQGSKVDSYEKCRTGPRTVRS